MGFFLLKGWQGSIGEAVLFCHVVGDFLQCSCCYLLEVSPALLVLFAVHLALAFFSS